MKYLRLLFLFVFLSFVLVQFNDPDPLLWIVLYGLGGLITLLSFLGKYKYWWAFVLIGIYFSGAAYLFPSVLEWIDKENGQNLMQRMVDNKMYIEETRECGGLLIAGIMLLINHFIKAKK